MDKYNKFLNMKYFQECSIDLYLLKYVCLLFISLENTRLGREQMIGMLFVNKFKADKL